MRSIIETAKECGCIIMHVKLSFMSETLLYILQDHLKLTWGCQGQKNYGIYLQKPTKIDKLVSLAYSNFSYSHKKV